MFQFIKPPFSSVRDAEGLKYCVVAAVWDTHNDNHFVIFTDGKKKENKYVSLVRRFDPNPKVSQLIETTDEEFMLIKGFMEKEQE